MLSYQPLAQFEITFFGYYKNLIPIDTSLVYLISVYFIIRYIFLADRSRWAFWEPEPMSYWVPQVWQTALQIIYCFVWNLISQQIGALYVNRYFPLLFSLFWFILISNLLGMALYSFTITSHAIVTFSLSFAFFIGIVILGLRHQTWRFIFTFIPSGSPWYLLPFMIFIEIISYISRPISLAIRLFANMMSGHTLLTILANFAIKISKKYFLIALIPFFLIVLIIGLELMIAVLQAYVFLILICIYLSDSIHGSH